MHTEQIYKQDTKAPLVSFIVTAYNLPTDMLRECIDSILNLSLSSDDRQIILVDDGSDVCPLNDLTDCRDSLIYVRQRNAGLSAARNTGLQVATGTFVQFVDGDDSLIRSPYEHCLDIARYENPDIVLFSISEDGNSEAEPNFRKAVTGSQYMRDNNLRASACGYIFRRSILGSLRFTPRLLHEDEEFTPLLMLRAERVIETSSTGYYYRHRTESITHTSDKHQQEKRLCDIEKIILHLRNVADTVPDCDKPALNRRVAQLTMDYLYDTAKITRSRKQLDDAIQQLSEAGLFPLPDKKYTHKYRLFSQMIRIPMLRSLLIMSIPR